MLSKVLMTIAGSLLPQSAKERHLEQWRADTAAAKSVGVSPLSIAWGALVFALKRPTPTGFQPQPVENQLTVKLVTAGALLLPWLFMLGSTIRYFLQNPDSTSGDLRAYVVGTPHLALIVPLLVVYLLCYFKLWNVFAGLGSGLFNARGWLFTTCGLSLYFLAIHPMVHYGNPDGTRTTVVFGFIPIENLSGLFFDFFTLSIKALFLLGIVGQLLIARYAFVVLPSNSSERVLVTA